MSTRTVRTRLAKIIAFCLGSLLACPALGQTKPVKLDVPYVPTNTNAVEAMLKLAKVTPEDYVFDLGCGDGRIVIAAAKDFKARGFGVDLDPKRISESNDNAAKAGVTDRVKFKLEDIMVTDVYEASVVALFLLDSVNLRLRPRLLAQLKPGARVVSNSFHMADWKPDKTIRVTDAYNGSIHLWIVPAPAGGVWTWKTKTAEGEIANSLDLRQQFQVLTGSVRFPQGGEVPIANASLVGKQIAFTASPRIGDKEVEIAYEGTVEGDSIKGTQKWASGPSAGTYPWTATRQRVDVIGRWQVVAPEHADDNGTLQIQRKDGGILATYVREKKPQEELALPNFYLWGSSLRFEVASDGAALVFTGRLTGDSGEGSVSVGREGGQASAWKAKRLPAK